MPLQQKAWEKWIFPHASKAFPGTRRQLVLSGCLGLSRPSVLTVLSMKSPSTPTQAAEEWAVETDEGGRGWSLHEFYFGSGSSTLFSYLRGNIVNTSRPEVIRSSPCTQLAQRMVVIRLHHTSCNFRTQRVCTVSQIFLLWLQVNNWFWMVLDWVDKWKDKNSLQQLAP